MNPVSSGPTAISALSATPTDLIDEDAVAGQVFSSGVIFNTGTVAASFSFTGVLDATRAPLPPGAAFSLPGGTYSNGIVVQGEGGTATGLYAVLFQGNVA